MLRSVWFVIILTMMASSLANGAGAQPNGSAPTPDCVIKGNINGSGEHIYHLPGQAYYDRTQISPSKGERWFCTEPEARAAGWRKAKV